MTDSIGDLRGRIDALDAQLLALINERAGLAQQIGKQKAAKGSEVYDPDRERSILDTIDELNKGPLDKGAVEEVFATIIAVCRELQMG